MRFVPAVLAAILLSTVGFVRNASAGATSGRAKAAIFVANDFDVAAFPLGTSGNIPPVVLTTDFAAPRGIARDSKGRIYVTNVIGDSISVFAPTATGNTRPLAVIGGPHTRLSSPMGIAIGPDGTIYVADGALRSGGAVTVYPPLGNGVGTLDEAPVAEIAGSKTLLDLPNGIALDSHGNIYVPCEVGDPFVSPKKFDVGRIVVYAAGSSGNAKPMTTISGDRTHLAFPISIALDPSDNIYVLNEYTAQAQSRQEHFATSVTVFQAASAGNTAPGAIISGGNTSLIPGGIAVDSSGNIYAAGCANTNGQEGCFSINVFPPGANGDVSPANAIFDIGVFPDGIAVDANRNVYVLNQDSGPVPGGE